MNKQRLNEIYGVILFALSLLVLISLFSYDRYDLPFYTSHPNFPRHNAVGIVGAYLSGALFFVLGLSAFLVPFLILIWSLGKFINREAEKIYIKAFGTIILFSASSATLSLIFIKNPALRLERGGIVGLYFSQLLAKYFGLTGAYVIVIALFILSLLLATEFLILPFAVSLFKFIQGAIFKLKEKTKLPKTLIKKPRFEQKLPTVKKEPEDSPILKYKKEEKEEKAPGPKFGFIPRKIVVSKNPAEVKKEKTAPPPGEIGDYKLPALDLLDSPPPIEERKIKESLELSANILEDTLRDFGIEVKVADVEQGPVITRYELEPAPGVKVNKITALSDDIALAMKAHSVRIVAPIPGKSRVGVEVPNSYSTIVYLKEILESGEFQNSKSKLTLALGKDVSGQSIVADLGDMPHLLIAGTTGSGKTVCVNSLITSLLFNATPDEVKFLMVDPKMVELAMFNDLPHLLCPVVTEAKKVSGALSWLVNEMEQRYQLFAKLGVRNIDLYNSKFKNGEIKLEETPERLPYIVVIIDELADLMVVASQDVENAITRLAQLSRAVGIHIILATQRPSVDVVTGVIKANFPARISFQVASKVDSRTVLDMNGADKLLGKGDMLFLKPGTAKPTRVQGTLISDKELERLVNFIKSQRKPDYDEEILKEQEKKSSAYHEFEKDEMFDEGVRMVLETGQASVSMLQRRLGLGYQRAARMIDKMEEEGIIGPFRGSRPREILINEYKGVERVKE